MAVIKRTRKQIESHIKMCAESIQKNGLEIGRDLIEIRDEELWDDEYESWSQYVQFGIREIMPGHHPGSIKNMVQGAEVQKRISGSEQTSALKLEHSHLSELSRLAPQKQKSDGAGREKDYSKLRRTDINRVLKNAVKLADGKDVSVRDIRKAVDADLGIDRAAKAKETKQIATDERDKRNELPNYLREKKGTIEGITANLAKVPADGWTQLEKSHPKLAEQFAAACDTLAELLRS